VGHAAHETEADAMTNTPPKRRFWQIHLSTLCVLVMLTAALLGVNVAVWSESHKQLMDYDVTPLRTLIVRETGFPLQLTTFQDGPLTFVDPTRSFFVHAINLAVAMATLFGTAFVLELLIRRRPTVDAPARPRIPDPLNKDAAPAPPLKHRFWQIHLSTAVIAMLVAGVLLGLNLRPPQILEVKFFKEQGGPYLVIFNDDGWPVRATAFRKEIFGDELELEALKAAIVTGEELGSDWNPEYGWRSPEWLVLHRHLINTIIAVGITAVTMVSCECFIRHRSKP
jgi:hypothetical protein